MIQQLKTTKIIQTALQEKTIYKMKRWLKNQSKKLKKNLLKKNLLKKNLLKKNLLKKNLLKKNLLKKNHAIMKNKETQFFLDKIMSVN
jgi:hypothetical protein